MFLIIIWHCGENLKFYQSFNVSIATFSAYQSAENPYLRSLETRYFKNFRGLRPSTPLGGAYSAPRPPSCFTRELRSLAPRFARSGPTGQFRAHTENRNSIFFRLKTDLTKSGCINLWAQSASQHPSSAFTILCV